MFELTCILAHEDARGKIIDVLRDEPIDHVTLITQAAGTERGHHYHKETTQWLFLITGSLTVIAQKPGDDVYLYLALPGSLIRHDPMEAHAVRAREEATYLIFTRGPRGGENYEKDTYRLEEKLSFNVPQCNCN